MTIQSAVQSLVEIDKRADEKCGCDRSLADAAKSAEQRERCDNSKDRKHTVKRDLDRSVRFFRLF